MAGVLFALAVGAAAGVDVDALWNFNDPAASRPRCSSNALPSPLPRCAGRT
jgi:hypothetical protein